ncbi:DNA topoisomerase I [Candidatus Woesearchaeota archaeon]|nr:DNA topoisomerase I [Candidatus Woesearchaeota archaeon]
MVELIITEKPKAAMMVASALSSGKPARKSINGVPYYELNRGKKDIVVGCAVGHLFGIGEVKSAKRKGWSYPVFDVEWKPIHEIDRSAAFSKKYLSALKSLCKGADSFVVATDYDIEGETIGLNVVRFVCRQKDARRMKFSTLTKDDLVDAYEAASPHLDWGQANAGIVRHELDWYWGINLSRALTSSIKKAGLFKILSIGRVQGPALEIIVKREREIRAFRPVPFWLVELKAGCSEGEFVAWHEKDKFWKKDEAELVLGKVKGHDGIVREVKRDEFRQPAPFPFDLTTLQTEAYRCFRINPKETLEIAQDLYTSGFISYPRTSSQKLPAAIGYEKIIRSLSRQKDYARLCSMLLKDNLKPAEGKKSDPAHPAIFPTGVAPKSLEGRKRKLYDLVVRRFLAAFGQPAVRQTLSVRIEVNSEIFVARGITTVEKGWHVLYCPYAKMKEEELPKLHEHEAIINRGVLVHSKETQPPKRYTPASIIKELERNNLGTKATRSEVIDTLFKRGYIAGQAIEATNLGMTAVETLERHCPEIIDPELTRHFEGEMEEIQEKHKPGEKVLDEAKSVLEKILSGFKKKEKEIGMGLITATKESEDKANTVGRCVSCDGTLMIKRGKFGRFIACSKYPECRVTFKLPSSGLVKVTDSSCKDCIHPEILIIRKAKQPQTICINPDCPSKASAPGFKERPCPSCKEGTVVLRKSIYGAFLACNRFPKCRYTERVGQPVQKQL